ncbi:zinc ribbon domain-containing protein, partial [Alistipes onderdonkii]
MFCPNCGKKCGDNDLFCGGCGTRLPARPVTASPAADAAPVAPAVRAAGDTPAASASHGAGIPSGCGAASAASA